MSRFHGFPLAACVVLALAAPPAWGQSADLQLVKLDSPDPVLAGDLITYELLLTNAGPDPAEFVSLDDTLPPGTTFFGLVGEPSWTCSTPAVGSAGTVSCSIDSLAVGISDFLVTVTVDGGVAPGTVITNTATASSETPDPDEGGPSASADTTVAAPPVTSDVSVTKVDDPDPVAEGANLVYTITVTSAGAADATNVNLVDALPPETSFVSLAEPAGWTCTTPAVGTNIDPVVCSIPTLAAGSAAFTLTVSVGTGLAPGTNILNSATVSAADDFEEGNNTGNASTAVLEPAAVTGTKTVSGSTFQPGSSVTYTVVLTNTGDVPQADNAGSELTDVLPPELVLVAAAATSGTAAANTGTNTVTWDGALSGGASVTITIDATIGAGVAAGTTVSNQGAIAYDADGNGSNEASSLTDDPTVAGSADPTTFQVAAPPPPPPPSAIPTADWRGLLALVALLGAAGAWWLRRSG